MKIQHTTYKGYLIHDATALGGCVTIMDGKYSLELANSVGEAKKIIDSWGK